MRATIPIHLTISVLSITPLVLDLFVEKPTVPTSRKRKHSSDNDFDSSLRLTQRMECQKLDAARSSSVFDKKMQLVGR